MTTAINYLDGPISPEREREALDKLCRYLVSKGKYKDVDAAKKDAAERVAFLEKADVYSDDPAMENASHDLKSTHALIAGHSLHGVLKEHNGYLPALEQPGSDKPAHRATHTITNVFGAIELDIRTGLARDQIITKLEEGGLSMDNAEEAYEFVRNQRKQRLQTRLIAAAVIIALSGVFFLLSDFFL